MADNVIKFGKARKLLARKTREAEAAENRVKYGLTKAEKIKAKALQETASKRIDGHKLGDNEPKL